MASPNFKNRTLFHGDNLTFLRGMNSGCVDLIPTDPPFKKQRGFFSDAGGFKDIWTWQRDALGLDDAGSPVAENHEEWLRNIAKDYPKVSTAVTAGKELYGDDMGAFLCWMAPRLLEMHRVLKPTGSLYLHCDHTAAAYLKVLLDAIFGKQHFRNEIVWCYTGPSNTTRWFPRKHDTILFYAKSPAAKFHRDAVRIDYKQLNVQHQQEGGGGIGGNLTPDTVDTYRELGKVPEDYWLEDRDKMSPVGRRASERTGYPTQKPLALYERIIQASSNPGDLVLDPFCGCATTCVAAERLGRQWVGMDISPVTEGLIRQRLEDNKQLLTDGVPVITVTPTPPVRTDDGATAASDLVLRLPAVRADWQKLTRAEMVRILSKVQSENGLVVCVGCGRALEPEFMQLDHREPKSDGGEDWITNRMLLCQPCNGRKSNRMTLSGLQAANRRNGWMKDADKARVVNSRALEAGRLVRDQWGSEYVRGLLAE